MESNSIETEGFLEFITSFVLSLGRDIDWYIYDDVALHEPQYWIPKYMIVSFPIILVSITVNAILEINQILKDVIHGSVNTMDEFTVIASLVLAGMLVSYAVIGLITDKNIRKKIIQIIKLFFFNKEFKEKYKKLTYRLYEN